MHVPLLATSVGRAISAAARAASAAARTPSISAAAMGITPEEYRLGRAQTAQSTNGAGFNPLTGEGTRRIGHKDFHQSCKRPTDWRIAPRPVYNPLTAQPNRFLSSAVSLSEIRPNRLAPIMTRRPVSNSMSMGSL